MAHTHTLPLYSSFLPLAGAVDSHTENGKNAGKDVLNPSDTKTPVKPRKQSKTVNY